MQRKTLKARRAKKRGGLYFQTDRAPQMFSSGCTALDMVLGGGWALGRVSNVVGDASTGKTLIAIEACANFRNEFEKSPIWYDEAEEAFEKPYAEALGMPIESINFPSDSDPTETVEVFERHLVTALDSIKTNGPGLYIIDSLDALSDDAEQKRELGKGSYNTAKPKMLSALLRKYRTPLSRKQLHLMVISQVRDNIGVTFGERHKRSGGKWLDFYASQVIWLARLKQIKRTIKKIERPVGIEIRAKCKKNKVSVPYRQCEFPIYFNFGIEDVVSGLEWLKEHKKLAAVNMSVAGAEKYIAKLRKLDSSISDSEYSDIRDTVASAVKEQWAIVEKGFAPTRSKYRNDDTPDSEKSDSEEKTKTNPKRKVQAKKSKKKAKGKR